MTRHDRLHFMMYENGAPGAALDWVVTLGVLHCVAMYYSINYVVVYAWHVMR